MIGLKNQDLPLLGWVSPLSPVVEVLKFNKGVGLGWCDGV